MNTLNASLLINTWHAYRRRVALELQNYLGFSISSTGSPERYRTPRGRATALCPPHTATLGVFGERWGVAVQLGELGEWKSVPGDGLDRSPLWRGIIKKRKSQDEHSELRVINVLSRCCTYYCCCTAVHAGWFGGWVAGGALVWPCWPCFWVRWGGAPYHAAKHLAVFRSRTLLCEPYVRTAVLLYMESIDQAI